MNKDRVIARLRKNSKIEEDGCWLFGRWSMQYGRMSVDNKVYLVSRLSAFIYLGLDINDPNSQANHKNECPNKSCWNPDHLYVGDQTSNMKDEIGKRSVDYCKKGHLKDGQIYLKKKNKYVRYCRICHNEKSKISEKKMGHASQYRYKERNS